MPGAAAALPFLHPPPFQVHALQGWALLSRSSGLPFRFWLRFACALVDCGTLVLLAHLLIRQGDPQAIPALMCSPPRPSPSSGFHGKTDAVLVFLVL